MIQKKRILIGTDFGATIPVQIILMSFVNGLEDWYDYEWKRNATMVLPLAAVPRLMVTFSRMV
ncbi:hypothetical protein, partial [Akkermansia sp.]|uniref:hypothetical protein n=1 Tax=Akkermansia sp. TaxID=1872421 RepID=UPI003AB87E5E